MIESKSESSGPNTAQRRAMSNRPTIEGVIVREDDIEQVRGIRAVAYLFRGMAVLLVILMAIQLLAALSGTVDVSIGVVMAEAVRLLIFAGLLWGVGDLAVLWVKSHYDIRASRILLARLAYMVRKIGESDGRLPPEDAGSRADRVE